MRDVLVIIYRGRSDLPINIYIYIYRVTNLYIWNIRIIMLK